MLNMRLELVEFDDDDEDLRRSQLFLEPKCPDSGDV